MSTHFHQKQKKKKKKENIPKIFRMKENEKKEEK